MEKSALDEIIIKCGLSCEDRTIEMFLRFRCLDLNTRRGWKISIIWWNTLYDLSPLILT